MNPSLPPSLIDIDSTYLPVGQMRLISRVTELQGGTIRGEVDLGAGHWVFPQHFPGDPIFPGSLIVEAAGQLLALWAWGQGARGRPRLVRIGAEFRSPVGPATARLVLQGEVKKKRNLCFANVSALVEGQEVAHVTAVLAVLPRAALDSKRRAEEQHSVSSRRRPGPTHRDLPP